MANLRLNQADLIGRIIPDVYVDKVTLETAGDFLKQRNPHIDFEGEEGRRDPLTGEILEGQQPTLSQSFLKVTVDLLMKDLLESDEITSWMYQNDFAKYLKVAVVASTSSPLTSLLAGEQFGRIFSSQQVNPTAVLAETIRRSEFSEFFPQPFGTVAAASAFVEKNFFYQTINLGSVVTNLNKQNYVEVQQSADGNQIKNIGLRVEFKEIQTENPAHLSVFAFTYIDIAALQDEFGDLDFGDPGELAFSTGRTVVQSVISESKVISDAVLYRDENGDVYAGPVHQMGSGVWMSGRFHGDLDREILLERVVLPNTTVQDFRNVKDIDKNIVDFTFFETTTFPAFDRTFKERIKANLDSAAASSYFSDLWLARGLMNQAVMAFSFNAAKFIKENTKYPALLTVKPDLARSEYEITCLKMMRRRVQKPPKFNDSIIGYNVDPGDIKPFDTNEPWEIILDGRETSPGFFPTVNAQNNGASMREMKITSDSSIRSFSIDDTQVTENTDGFYQYGVEIQIKDNLSAFLQRELNKLNENRKLFIEYFTEASEPVGNLADPSEESRNPHIASSTARADQQSAGRRGNYNVQTNRFTQEFIDKQAARYANRQDQAPWIKTIANLSVLLNLFSSEDRQAEALINTRFRRNMWSLCSPQTGSPDGIEAVLKLVDNVADKISMLLGISTSATTETSPSGPQENRGRSDSAGSADPQKSLYKVVYWFTNAIFDSNQLDSTGFHYLLDSGQDIQTASTASPLPGLRVLSDTNFRSRIRNETLRFFTDADPALPTEEVSNLELMRLLANTAAADYSYLSPAEISVNGGKSYRLMDEDMFSNRSILATITDILNIKSPPNEPKRIPSPRGTNQGESQADFFDRVIRDNLVEVLADRNCTVEIPVFSPEQAAVTANRQIRQEPAPPSPRGLPALSGLITKIDQEDGVDSVQPGAAQYLGDNQDRLQKLKENLENLIDIHTTRDGDVFNPGLVFLRTLFNTLIQNEQLVNTTAPLENEVLATKFSINDYSIMNPTNSLERYRSQRLGPMTRVLSYSDFVPSIPNQVKSLYLASHPSGREITTIGNPFADENILADPVRAIPLFLRFMNLTTIEVFTEFRTVTQEVASPQANPSGATSEYDPINTVTKTDVQMKSPVWQRLTRELFQQLFNEGREMLCRLKPYSDARLNVQPLKGIQLPVYDEYFIVRPNLGSDLTTTPGIAEEPPATDLVNLETTLRDTSREYISTDPKDLKGEATTPVDTDGDTANVQAAVVRSGARGNYGY